MKLKHPFVFTVAATMVIGWADTFFFGTSSNSTLSFPVRQSIHVGSYTVVFYIGYLYWRQVTQKWVLSLWLLTHLLLLSLIALVATVEIVNPRWLNLLSAHFIITLRNMATGPLPLLAFYTLYQVQNKLTDPSEEN